MNEINKNEAPEGYIAIQSPSPYDCYGCEAKFKLIGGLVGES